MQGNRKRHRTRPSRHSNPAGDHSIWNDRDQGRDNVRHLSTCPVQSAERKRRPVPEMALRLEKVFGASGEGTGSSDRPYMTSTRPAGGSIASGQGPRIQPKKSILLELTNRRNLSKQKIDSPCPAEGRSGNPRLHAAQSHSPLHQ